MTTNVNVHVTLQLHETLTQIKQAGSLIKNIQNNLLRQSGKENPELLAMSLKGRTTLVHIKGIY